MSDDEDMDFPSDDEPFVISDDDDDFEEIRREAEQRRRQQVQAAARPQRQPAPIPLHPAQPLQPYGAFGLGGMLHQAMNAGFQMGGLGGRASAAMFRQEFEAYSTALHEASEGRMDRINGGRQNLMFGGNILMPPEALDLLSKPRLDIESPWTFELVNPTDRTKRTHAGVLEFTAQQGRVYLPQWMMLQLGLEEGARLRIMGASLPKGKFVKLQWQDEVFLELSDPKAVLERALSNYPCLTVGDLIEITHQHINLRFLIMEAKARDEHDASDGINILNTDIEVDFASPPHYKEPVRPPPKPLPTMAEKLGINVEQKEDRSEANGFDAFVGQGNSLGGKRVKGKGVKARPIGELDPESRARRTDRQTFINANNMTSNDAVPAALCLPYGHLFFGFPLVPRPNGAATDLGGAEPNGPSFSGQGATLSGRLRPNQDQRSASGASAKKSESDAKSFGGTGNTLGKKREVIEID